MVYIGFSLKYSKTMWISVFLSVFFYRGAEVFLAYTAAFVHECAHGFAAFKLGIKPKGIKLGVFGIKLTLPYVMYSKDKIIIWSAGPMVSFAVGCIFFVAGKLMPVNCYYCGFFIFANFAIGIINLLPVYPLDGETILKSALTIRFGIIKSAKIVHLAESIMYLLMWGVYIILCFWGEFNPSIAGVLLFLSINKSRENTKNMSDKKMVLSGEIVSRLKLKYIACHADSELLCLAECISPDYTLIVAAFCNERFVGDLCQADIIEGINKYGALCTAGQYIQQRQNKCFSEL